MQKWFKVLANGGEYYSLWYLEHQASLTAGTLFHGTRNPLLLWFYIMWWVVAQKNGVSASNMMDFMGFGSLLTWAKSVTAIPSNMQAAIMTFTINARLIIHHFIKKIDYVEKYDKNSVNKI